MLPRAGALAPGFVAFPGAAGGLSCRGMRWRPGGALTDSSNVPWQPARTAASMRSATTRHHGARTAQEASSTRSVTCGSPGTGLPCNGSRVADPY
jgi:hypothetical protein